MERLLKRGWGFIFAVLFGVLALNTSVFASTNLNSAVGYWQTIDKKTNKPSSVIKIWQQDGKYYGKIFKIFTEDGHKTTDRCVKCRGEDKNKPMLGLVIVRNMTYKGNQYVNGQVLDPTSGKIYHAKMWVANKGQELRLRGYIGIPLFGRTATWYRVK